MNLLNILGLGKNATGDLPSFIRAIDEIRGVRVLRLRGAVGKEIGRQVQVANKEVAETGGVFTRPLLLDFQGTTEWDFSTVSYIIQQLRNRMGAGGAGGATGRPARVGIINAPPELRAELEMAKLDEVLRVYGTEQEALDAMGKE